jgi:hypothetical protein
MTVQELVSESAAPVHEAAYVTYEHMQRSASRDARAVCASVSAAGVTCEHTQQLQRAETFIAWNTM